ncbi:Fibrinogen binding protein,PPM-type phosphatase domain,PPM-type phosphatase, divalent cation binding [Cinara cedri]|uniref:protein-serine/threonine phosphatase n=1 Tax=Cinara cedri TaxID=506608 RepID=A0A5E4NGM6_9HEMI|nr:Fibrinogen binding protein,PPM-type phosphatase domain,PPM-type phosphatase, divalent cation binding [Cinara cedri]
MGNYLRKPVTVKDSHDMENSTLMCGVSSMQGWRETQEDAHNCLIDFDKDVSLFAVYDGHGGAEIALYAADQLPQFVRDELAKKKSYKDALINSYLKFDDSLIDPPVVEKLNTLREELSKEENNCVDADEDEPLDELFNEAKLPIEDIILKYKKQFRNLHKENNTDQPGSSKESSTSKTGEESSNSDTIVIDLEKALNDACNSKAADTKKDETENGVNEIKFKVDNEEAGGSSSSKVNGTNDKLTNEIENAVPGPSKSEGSSSSQEQNGSVEPKPEGTAYMIGNDASENDTSSDSEDELFEPEIPSSSEEESLDDSGSETESEDDVCYSNSLLANICGMDDDDEDDLAGKDSGCTAVMALLVKGKLYVANAGDSRCVVSIDGKAFDMSKDHKPEDEIELNRITAAGGRVSSDGRVNGGLNLSRALGDHKYKNNDKLPNTEQMITALPDVTDLDIKPESINFIVLACDGIWNSLSSQEVVDFISERINNPDVKLSLICEELFDKCLAPDTLSDGTGCDNMTCIIVKFKFNNLKRSYTETEDTEDSVDVIEIKKLKTDSAENSDCMELNEPETDAVENSDGVQLIKPETDAVENSDGVQLIKLETDVVELIKSEIDSTENSECMELNEPETDAVENSDGVELIKPETDAVENSDGVELIKLETDAAVISDGVELIKSETDVVENSDGVELIKLETDAAVISDGVELNKSETDVVENSDGVELIKLETDAAVISDGVELIKPETDAAEESDGVELNKPVTDAAEKSDSVAVLNELKTDLTENSDVAGLNNTKTDSAEPEPMQ